MGGLAPEAAFLLLGSGLVATILTSLALRAVFTAGATDRGAELKLYQLAMLAGGPKRVSDTALSFLAWSGMIEVRESTDRLVRIVGPSQTYDLHPIEASVLAAIGTAGVRPDAAMGAGRLAAEDQVRDLTGLVVEPSRRLLLSVIAVGGSLALVLASVWWMLTTEADGWGFVPLIAISAALFAAWWAVAGKPWRTVAGSETLEAIRARFDTDLEAAAVGITSLPQERAMPVIALYGRDALTGGLSGLRKVIVGRPASDRAIRSAWGQ